MENKDKKIKTWIEKHREEIKSEAVRIGWYAFGFGVGYFASRKIFLLTVDKVLAEMRDDGLIKFFDPSTGLETGLKEHRELIKRMGK